MASLNAVFYWLSNPIWLGGSLTILAVTTFGEFFTPLNGIWKYVFAFAFIWFAVWSAILSFGVGKWIPTIGAWVRIGVLGLFSATVVIYAVSTRRARGFRGRVQALLGHLHRGGPGAVLQLRQLRAPQRRRR